MKYSVPNARAITSDGAHPTPQGLCDVVLMSLFNLLDFDIATWRALSSLCYILNYPGGYYT